MLLKEIRDIKSGKAELRRFAITFCIVFALMGSLFLLKKKGFYSYFFIISFIFFVFGLLMPRLLKSIYKTWMMLTIIIGWFLTGLVLVFLYYIVITPIGLLGRLFGKKFLDFKIDNNTNSYWIPKKKDLEIDKYKNQY